MIPRRGPRSQDRRTVLGLDEAGRGSVLGPLVVGGFLCESGKIRGLSELGVRDSKRLSPSRRAELYRALASHGERHSIALSPARIDRAVAGHQLNALEAEAFAELIRRTRPDEVALDACDVDAGRFGSTVARLAGFDGPMDSRHRADAELPIVGGASIVAKVRRDGSIARLDRRYGGGIGSGYPSDARTVDFVRKLVSDGERRPAGLRLSWATTERVMEERRRRTLEEFD